MKRRRWLQTSLGAGALAALGAGLALTGAATGRVAVPATPWRERLLLGFGSTLSLRAAHPDGALAERALDGAVATIRRIEGQMSLFRADSALSRLNRDGVLHDPPADLLAVLQIAQAVSARSAGSFDVTVQPLWQAFATARGQGRLPTPAEVRAARERVGWAALQPVSGCQVFSLRVTMQLTSRDERWDRLSVARIFMASSVTLPKFGVTTRRAFSAFQLMSLPARAELSLAFVRSACTS